MLLVILGRVYYASSSSVMAPRKRPASPGSPVTQSGDGPAVKPARRVPSNYRRINKAALRARLVANFHVEGSIVDLVLSSILDTPPQVTFDDVVGQEQAVKLLRERVVYPALNPTLFNGQKFLRPPRGVLLFGPTGNGKTLLAKACAAQTNYNFMNLTASVLVSKWVGDSEKIIKILFECARDIQPCIIFIDEIDAVLSQRTHLERDDTRRFKNEFLTQFDGLMCNHEERIMVLGATNLPQGIDTAALRRFDLRIFLGPPDCGAREVLLRRILREVRHNLSDAEVRHIAKISQQYSASDLGVIVRNAAWLPLGTIDPTRIPKLKEAEIPLIGIRDFQRVMEHFVPSGYQSDLKLIEQWTQQHRRQPFRQCTTNK
ncbi:spastin-like isoform X2 [Paramacrobiotus metropolitanus]|uniref:spastin-like isoform X2 n=1 Tax=Paramacrobiotus metropolitanus TaxID=2943436 RepID=UPI0024464CC3|nr:spastin-like isoform X2 [Paramacrobiotus metropolitanus]